MNRLLIASAVAAAACAVSVPAVAGLAGNPSFNHRLPVHVPSQARLVQVDDHGRVVVAKHGSDHPTSTRVPSPVHKSRGAELEPGDDHGGTDVRTPEPGDDNGGATATESGDDRGGATATATQPGDDRGGATESGDDRSGSGHGG